MLGKLISEDLYPRLFTTTFNLSHIEVHSTDYDRTLISAQSQLQGLFSRVGKSMNVTTNTSKYYRPPNSGVSWPTPNNTYAIPPGLMVYPVHTIPSNLDDLFMIDFKEVCPNANKLFYEIGDKN